MLMLFIFVIAELAGPFVAKTMIDDHIVGIENLGMKQNRVKMLFRIMGLYKRSDRFEQGEKKEKSTRDASRFSILFCTE